MGPTGQEGIIGPAGRPVCLSPKVPFSFPLFVMFLCLIHVFKYGLRHFFQCKQKLA